MKRIIICFVALCSFNLSAGNPEKKVDEKPTFVISPQNPTDSPNGYLVHCCSTINYGYDLNGCLNWGIQCWGECAGHGWLITVCKTSSVVRGALATAEEKTGTVDSPVSVNVPVSVRVTTLQSSIQRTDLISSLISLHKIENSIVSISETLKVESEDAICIYKPGKYQIENSALKIVAQKLTK